MHNELSNIVYHILEIKVLIDGNMAKLIGVEKRHYEDDIIDHLSQNKHIFIFCEKIFL
jgi:hypothetical protein